MKTAEEIIQAVFSIKNETQFHKTALAVFRFQYTHNAVYRTYIDNLNIKPEEIAGVQDIPFLPIDFFKTHKVLSSKQEPESLFLSSGTTNMQRSKHYITALSIYETSFLRSFSKFYGKPDNYVFLALLPSYSEQGNSSLIYMVSRLMQISNKKNNGFFLYNHEDLFKMLLETEEKKQRTILFGVSFALTDFFEKYKLKLENTIIIETGGMKGRKKEIIKEELHQIIRAGSGLAHIHSEYGMTELLSQAYSDKGNNYRCPPWMKVLIRDTNDPFSFLEKDKSGGINIIDLANIYSCSFIETKDLGRINKDNSFNILGRFDNSDIRGCNLLAV